MKKYNTEFKSMIVELYKTGHSVKELSREYGVSEVTIYKWIKQIAPITSIDDTDITLEEIKRMKQEMLRLQEENENLKKGYDHIREKVTQSELCQFIDQHHQEHDIKQLCEVLSVPRSTYYQSKHQIESKWKRENHQLLERIKKIYFESSRRYGAIKVHRQLIKEGFSVSLKRVQRLMKSGGLASIIQKKYTPYKQSKELVLDRDNILEQDFSTTSINQKWVSDITYIHVQEEGWCYLASVMDLHSKKIIGYHFSKQMTTDIIVQALKNAYVSQSPKDKVILHTDLGTQYTSQDFKNLTSELNVVQSFSRKGCPYDNACIESFHATLKKEEVYQTKYVTFEQARMALFQYIEGWYNRKRIHGSINYLTPEECEQLARQIA
ncbi:MAG: IS3 family transposase [Turicibacter sanguinis]|uniref:IS3 family transposase n=1 Tax=Turicibacter TaxID=191303 RepID=UPI001E4F6723|nr:MULTISPECIES: IS3 family transposase [Turicibacter]MCU7202225.1 IS3 family transposase [Turicibacter sanguinis]MDB8566170.1 IS3 family transposase [Turicibacter sanguinis]MDB8568966.1 IS3 family transposase [Turicibacter sanguinis]MDB8571671.1 IS3 family transposase [Turicibacter sanguinis]MDB8580475.1 IS3 family transposase [Turicibacter sanguinis]